MFKPYRYEKSGLEGFIVRLALSWLWCRLVFLSWILGVTRTLSLSFDMFIICNNNAKDNTLRQPTKNSALSVVTYNKTYPNSKIIDNWWPNPVINLSTASAPKSSNQPKPIPSRRLSASWSRTSQASCVSAKARGRSAEWRPRISSLTGYRSTSSTFRGSWETCSWIMKDWSVPWMRTKGSWWRRIWRDSTWCLKWHRCRSKWVLWWRRTRRWSQIGTIWCSRWRWINWVERLIRRRRLMPGLSSSINTNGEGFLSCSCRSRSVRPVRAWIVKASRTFKTLRARW